MRTQILKAFRHGEPVDMIYMAADGRITKRRIKILAVSGSSFQAYCFLRKEKRTFKLDNVLSVMPAGAGKKKAMTPAI